MDELLQLVAVFIAMALILPAVGFLDACGQKWVEIVDAYNRPMRGAPE